MTAEFYTESGRISPRMFILLPIAFALLIPLGFVYGWLCVLSPLVILNILAAFGYAFAAGFLATLALEQGHVRNKIVRMAAGFAVGAFALVCAWAGFLQSFTEHEIKMHTFLLNPGPTLGMIGDIYERGWFSVKGSQVSGIALGAMWLVEAAAVLAAPVILAGSTVVYCEDCGKLASDEPVGEMLLQIPEDALLSAIQSQDPALLNADRFEVDVWRVHHRIEINDCSGCHNMPLLTVHRQQMTTNDKGKNELEDDEIIEHMKVTPAYARAFREAAARPALPVPTAGAEEASGDGADAPADMA